MPDSIKTAGQLRHVRSTVEGNTSPNKQVQAPSVVNLTQEDGCNFYNTGELPQWVKNYFGMTKTNPMLPFKTFFNESSCAGHMRHRITPNGSSECVFSFGCKMGSPEPFKILMQQGLFYGGVLRRGVEEIFEFYEQPELNKNNLSIHTKKEGFFCEDGFLIAGVQICESDPGTELEEINFHQGVFYESGGGLKYGKATIKLPGDDQEVVCEGNFSESGCLK